MYPRLNTGHPYTILNCSRIGPTSVLFFWFRYFSFSVLRAAQSRKYWFPPIKPMTSKCKLSSSHQSVSAMVTKYNFIFHQERLSSKAQQPFARRSRTGLTRKCFEMFLGQMRKPANSTPDSSSRLAPFWHPKWYQKPSESQSKSSWKYKCCCKCTLGCNWSTEDTRTLLFYWKTNSFHLKRISIPTPFLFEKGS
jgi:hypothetical protein